MLLRGVKLKKVGQLSLPRLEKISQSMTWESGLLYNDERWAGPKLFILHKLLARYSFLKKVKRIRINWNTQKPGVIASFNGLIQNKIFTRKRTGRYELSAARRYHVFSTYVYQRDNVYTTLVLYSCAVSRNNSLRQINKRIKILSNKLNVTKQHPFWFL